MEIDSVKRGTIDFEDLYNFRKTPVHNRFKCIREFKAFSHYSSPSREIIKENETLKVVDILELNTSGAIIIELKVDRSNTVIIMQLPGFQKLLTPISGIKERLLSDPEKLQEYKSMKPENLLNAIKRDYLPYWLCTVHYAVGKFGAKEMTKYYYRFIQQI